MEEEKEKDTKIDKNKKKEEKEDYDRNLKIEDWRRNKKGKSNVWKIIHWIKDYNKQEDTIKEQIDIEKLRTYKDREEFKERRLKRIKKMQTLYEEIINKNIEINIKEREMNMEEDIGKMLQKILEKTEKKLICRA
jgi:hypothetical protein